MRFVGRIFTSFLSALFLLGAFGVFLPQTVVAQECSSDAYGDCPEDGVSESAPTPVAAPAAISTGVDGGQHGYQDIFGTGPRGDGAIGLIFINICSSAPPAPGVQDDCVCRDSGNCSLDDILQVFVNITILILGLIGSIILLMFVYGGFLWITAQGEAKRIEKGKDTITHAVIGFAIILLSYTLISFLIASLAGDQVGEDDSDTLEEIIDNAGVQNTP